MKLFMKIVGFLMLFFLVIALILALVGIDKINFDDTYYKFLLSISGAYDKWKLEIPNIPTIDALSSNTEWYELILNAFIGFVNGFFSFLNVIINIINYIIMLIQFISTFIYCMFKDLPQILSDNGYHPII